LLPTSDKPLFLTADASLIGNSESQSLMTQWSSVKMWETSGRRNPRIVFLKVFFAAILFLAANGLAWGQVDGAISGKVEDASGAAISHATVTVTNLETGATRVVTTNESGLFRVLSVPVGQQQVKVEKAGFKTAVHGNINLVVGQEAVVNSRLQVAAVRQEMTVTDTNPVVNTTTSSVSGLVGEREVKELPLNGRSFDSLITLNAGTVNYDAMKSAHTTTSNGNAFSVSGQRPGDNLFLLNGVEYTGASQLAVTPGGVSGYLLGIDAVREFNVLTDNYSAEYGKRAGAQVAIVTQSGGNTLHGSLYEFLRNSAFDARNYFDQGSIPPFRQNQFGAALGGPLKKNKLFLFGNYEGFRQRLAVTTVSVVPDSNARQGILANSPCTAANPCTSMLPYMALWPQANGPEVGGGTAYSYNDPKQSIREDFGTLRSDYIIRDRDTLSASYTIDDGNSLIPLADPLFASSLVLRSQVASLQETHIVSSQVLNNFTAGFSRAGFRNDSTPYVSFPSDLSFVSGFGPGGIVVGGGVTTTGLAGITYAGPNNASNVWNERNLFSFTDNLQITKGIHQISLGVWLQPLQDNEDTASRQLGQATFTSMKTLLQGTVSNFQVVPNATELGWQSLMGAWYLQDDIKLRRNLTLLLGIRHEFTSGWNEVQGRASNFITDANGVLETNPSVGDSAFTKNNAKWLFGPRVALAWDVFGNGKTALRAGFGTYYSLLDALAFQLNSNPPYNGTLSRSSTATIPLSLSSIVPVVPGAPLPPACGPGVPKPCSTYAPQGVQADAKTPTVQRWNLTLEQELDRNTALRIAYVGSFGYHGLVSIDPNTIPAQLCASPSGCLAGGIGATTSVVPQGAQYIPVGSRPNPYLGAGFFWYTEGNSSYNALETELSRHLGRSLQLRANYTFSKNLDMNSALTGAQGQNQPQMILNRNDPRADWGLSALNVTHQAHLSGTYQLPIGRGQRFLNPNGWLASKIASGWQLDGIATFASGFPFTPQVGSSVSGDGDTRNPDRPSWNPSFTGPIVEGNPAQWFNPNAFLIPAAGTYGNVGRSVLTGPGLSEVDLAMVKNTHFSERVNLQFRAEFFNVLNHTNFGTPNPIVFSGSGVNPSAGLITSTATTSRQIQFGLKMVY
jgi:hypothetical protein